MADWIGTISPITNETVFTTDDGLTVVTFMIIPNLQISVREQIETIVQTHPYEMNDTFQFDGAINLSKAQMISRMEKYYLNRPIVIECQFVSAVERSRALIAINLATQNIEPFVMHLEDEHIVIFQTNRTRLDEGQILFRNVGGAGIIWDYY